MQPTARGIAMTYLRNVWYVAAWSSEVAPGKMLSRRLLNEPVVLRPLRAEWEAAVLEYRAKHGDEAEEDEENEWF